MLTKFLKSSLLIAFAALLLEVFAQQTNSVTIAAPRQTDSTQTPKNVKSPLTTSGGTIGKTTVTIDYGSPRVRGRVIWGGLVGYGTVWATGAHDATAVTFSRDVVIAGTTVKAGKYALFTIPDKTEWTVIINKNFDQHLADDYDAKLDIVRVKVTPKPLEKVQEELLFSVSASGISASSASEGAINFAWEKLTWSLPFKTL